MKKHILTLTALTLAAALLSGCLRKPTVTLGGANYTNPNACEIVQKMALYFSETHKFLTVHAGF